MATRKKPSAPTNAKLDALEAFRDRPEGTSLTTDEGGLVAHTDDSLKAGPRGPTLLEDFHLREKITRFDHERIPERVVHARGSAAHGVFRVYDDSLARVTAAKFLSDPKRKTPVFCRFSTVGGSRGSADTVRDVRGFAVKFYTEEGNFDLVGNNMPVFFIQDGIKFPDIVHAVKPEPHHEMPQASSAHDSFWDFVSLVPESAHMVMWLMSDRAIPRSYRMMEGFGVHTFRFVDTKGRSTFVKFHWKPLLGACSLVWDEAQKLSGKDPDFHRRDLWESIEAGAFPEWELGVQLIPESMVGKLPFDLLDPTKLVPEELVPVVRVGKMTLDRNPDNFFAETEQVAFCVSHVVPGIDFTDDPLMQARLFSYLDTQLSRLGGPNFAEIPINKPIAPVHNHQQDGFHRAAIHVGPANYHPNSTGGGCPFLAGAKGGGFVHFPEPMTGVAGRVRSESFSDHFSQARMFLDSQSPVERKHLTDACRFELSKVERKEIRARVVNEILLRIDERLAREVGDAIGVAVRAPKVSQGATSAPGGKSDKGGKDAKGTGAARVLPPSPALSLDNQPRGSIATRKVAVLVAPGVDGSDVEPVVEALRAKGATVHLVAPTLGPIAGTKLEADLSFLVAPSVMFDAIYVPGGKKASAALAGKGEVLGFIEEAYRHYKPIGATGTGRDLVHAALHHGGPKPLSAAGVVFADEAPARGFVRAFVAAIGKHRHWDRLGYPQ